MLKLPFFNSVVHFPAILKPIHNNLSTKKDKASITYQTQDDDSLKKKRKKNEFWVQVRNFPSIPQQRHYSSINQSQPKIESKSLKTKLFNESSWLL